MRCNEPQAFPLLLKQAIGLSQIQEHTTALAKLNSIISELLPSSLHEKCRIANYRQGILVLEVSSASWLTRLKYEQSALLSALRQNTLPALSSIQYKINPDMTNYEHQFVNNPTINATISSTLTQQSANYLYKLAEQAPEKLKKQLIKLANHAK